VTKQIGVTTYIGSAKILDIHRGVDRFTVENNGNLRIWAGNEKVAEYKIWSSVSKEEEVK